MGNHDQNKGKAEQVKGTVKEKWGELTNDKSDELSGKTENLKGQLREKVGDVKENLKDKQTDDETSSRI